MHCVAHLLENWIHSANYSFLFFGHAFYTSLSLSHSRLLRIPMINQINISRYIAISCFVITARSHASSAFVYYFLSGFTCHLCLYLRKCAKKNIHWTHHQFVFIRVFDAKLWHYQLIFMINLWKENKNKRFLSGKLHLSNAFLQSVRQDKHTSVRMCHLKIANLIFPYSVVVVERA